MGASLRGRSQRYGSGGALRDGIALRWRRQAVDQECRSERDDREDLLVSPAHGLSSRRNLRMSSNGKPSPCRKRSGRARSRSRRGGCEKRLRQIRSMLAEPSAPAARKAAAIASSPTPFERRSLASLRGPKRRDFERIDCSAKRESESHPFAASSSRMASTSSPSPPIAESFRDTSWREAWRLE